MHRRARKRFRLKLRAWLAAGGRTCGQQPDGLLRCHWCPALLTFKALAIDHEPPRAEGGSDDFIVLACWPCNFRRHQELERRRVK